MGIDGLGDGAVGLGFELVDAGVWELGTSGEESFEGGFEISNFVGWLLEEVGEEPCFRCWKFLKQVPISVFGSVRFCSVSTLLDWLLSVRETEKSGLFVGENRLKQFLGGRNLESASQWLF